MQIIVKHVVAPNAVEKPLNFGGNWKNSEKPRVQNTLKSSAQPNALNGTDKSQPKMPKK